MVPTSSPWQRLKDAYQRHPELRSLAPQLIVPDDATIYLTTLNITDIDMPSWQTRAQEYGGNIALLVTLIEDDYYPLSVTDHPDSPIWIVPKALPSEILHQRQVIKIEDLEQQYVGSHLIIS